MGVIFKWGISVCVTWRFFSTSRTGFGRTAEKTYWGQKDKDSQSQTEKPAFNDAASELILF